MYPIEITEADLSDYGITTDGKPAGEVRRFLKIIHQTFYELIILVTQRHWRLAVIEKYKDELEQPIKDILCNIAYETDSLGDFKALFDGRARTDTGSYDLKELQIKIANALSPLVWNQIFALEPNLLFCGGADV